MAIARFQLLTHRASNLGNFVRHPTQLAWTLLKERTAKEHLTCANDECRREGTMVCAGVCHEMFCRRCVNPDGLCYMCAGAYPQDSSPPEPNALGIPAGQWAQSLTPTGGTLPIDQLGVDAVENFTCRHSRAERCRRVGSRGQRRPPREVDRALAADICDFFMCLAVYAKKRLRKAETPSTASSRSASVRSQVNARSDVIAMSQHAARSLLI